MNPSGWKPEPLTWKDISHERVYGAPSVTKIEPLNRDTSGIPIVYQGTSFNCVAATVTWIKQYLEKKRTGTAPALSHEFLAAVSQTAPDGATPRQVLVTAKNVGICESEVWISNNKKLSVELELAAKKYEINGFAYLHNLSPSSVYAALTLNPVMVGVDSYNGSEPHMMAAYEVEQRNNVWGCNTKNWWQENVQDEGWIPFSDIRFVASILEEKPDRAATVPVWAVLNSQWSFVTPLKKALIAICGIITSLFGAAGTFGLSETSVDQPVTPIEQSEKPSETKFGAAGVYDQWNSTISGSGMTASDTTVPVSSLTIGITGVSITSASTTFPVYLTINPNSTADREVVECNGLSGSTFTNCYRQIAPVCNNSTSTIQAITGTSGAFPHPAGEPVIMSNNACFFNRFLDTNTDQTATGTKTLTGGGGVIKIGDNTSTTCKFIYFPNGQANPPYVKSCGAPSGGTTSTLFFSPGGTSATDLQFNSSGTSLGVSPTGGLYNASGFLGISVSSTGGFATDTNSLTFVAVSSTPSTNGGFLKKLQQTGETFSRIFWDVASFLAGNWTITGSWSFPGTATSTVSNGTVSTFDSLSKLSATGTAGMSIVPGQALYVSPTGTLFLTSIQQTTTTYPYVGIAQSSANVGQTIIYARPGAIAQGFSGLTPGKRYYLGASAGDATATIVSDGNVPLRIGMAVSSTAMQLHDPIFYAASTTWQAVGTIKAYDLGFIPSSVLVYGQTTPVGGRLNNVSPTSTWQMNQQGSVSSTTGCLDQTYTTTSRGIVINLCGAGVNAMVGVRLEYDLGGIPLH